MPIHKSAIKKVRQDIKKTARNLSAKRTVKGLIRTYKAKPSILALQKVQSALFLSVKSNVIHKNKARCLLSRLSKSLSKPAEKKTPLKKKTSK